MRSCLGIWVIFAVGCGSSGGGGNPDASAPTIAVTGAPANGTTVKNDNMAADGITLTVTVTGGVTLVDPNTHSTDVAGQGHFHVYLDSETSYLTYQFTTPVQVAIPMRVTASAAPGTPHTLHVALETNTHSPYPGASPSNTIMFNAVQ